jgi:hypothetical protein
MDVCLLCLYVVLSCVGRGLCDGLITRPEESYRVSVSVCVITETPKGALCSKLGTTGKWMMIYTGIVLQIDWASKHKREAFSNHVQRQLQHKLWWPKFLQKHHHISTVPARGSISGRGKGFFLYPPFPDQLCHPASYPVGTGGPFPGVKRGRGLTLTTHPNLLLRPRMSYTSSSPWRLHGGSGTALLLFVQSYGIAVPRAQKVNYSISYYYMCGCSP